MSDSISPGDGTSQKRIQPGRYLWIVLPLVTGITLAQGFMRQGFPVLYPFIQDEFGLSRAQLGLITSFQAIGYTIAVLLAGWLTDTLGVKRMITIGMLCLTAFILAFPLAYSFHVILVLSALIGIAASPLYPATTRAIIDWFSVRIRALAMSIKQMGIPITGAITAAVLPTLAVVIGWRLAAASMGLLVLIIAISFILLYRDAPRSIQAVRKINLITFRTILRNRGLVTIIIWGAVFIGIQFIVVSYFMLFLIEELGLSTILAGGMLAVAQVSSIIARVLWGAASDFIFQGRRIPVLAIIGFITVLWMLGASFTSMEVPSIAVYMLTIVMGISTISFHGVLATIIGEQAEAGQVGVTMGLASTLNNVSQVVMPPLFGYLVDISDSYSLVWRGTAAVALICTLALLTFGRDPQRR
ncbi:MFS transporter [Chloroflexota bacterium]